MFSTEYSTSAHVVYMKAGLFVKS